MLTLALIAFGMRMRLFHPLVRMPSRSLSIALSHDFSSIAVAQRTTAGQPRDVFWKHRDGKAVINIRNASRPVVFGRTRESVAGAFATDFAAAAVNRLV
jgi:hypothetical protein